MPMSSAYPKFVWPSASAQKSPREWTSKEADAYKQWLVASVPARTSRLLSTLGIDQSLAEHEVVLREAGQGFLRLVQESEFSGGGRLTDAGYALAADMGLLVTRLLFERHASGIRWEVLKRPRTDASFNLPVIRGPGFTFDPVAAAIANGIAVLQNRRTPDVFGEMYRSTVEDLKAHDSRSN